MDLVDPWTARSAQAAAPFAPSVPSVPSVASVTLDGLNAGSSNFQTVVVWETGF